MEKSHSFIVLGIIIAAIVAANTPACNPPAHTPSSLQQAKQICEEVYADSDDSVGYSECISKSKRMLDRQ